MEPGQARTPGGCSHAPVRFGWAGDPPRSPGQRDEGTRPPLAAPRGRVPCAARPAAAGGIPTRDLPGDIIPSGSPGKSPALTLVTQGKGEVPPPPPPPPAPRCPSQLWGLAGNALALWEGAGMHRGAGTPGAGGLCPELWGRVADPRAVGSPKIVALFAAAPPPPAWPPRGCCAGAVTPNICSVLGPSKGMGLKPWKKRKEMAAGLLPHPCNASCLIPHPGEAAGVPAGQGDKKRGVPVGAAPGAASLWGCPTAGPPPPAGRGAPRAAC